MQQPDVAEEEGPRERARRVDVAQKWKTAVLPAFARSTRKYVRTAIDALLSVTATMRYQKRRWLP